MINKQSLIKAKRIDRENLILNRKEQEEKNERSFAIKYEVCPKCSNNLQKTKKKSFLDYIILFYNPMIILKCKSCGFSTSYINNLY